MSGAGRVVHQLEAGQSHCRVVRLGRGSPSAQTSEPVIYFPGGGDPKLKCIVHRLLDLVVGTTGKAGVQKIGWPPLVTRYGKDMRENMVGHIGCTNNWTSWMLQAPS